MDFKQRVKAGDGFDLFYELVQDDNGAEKPGELLYAAVTIGGETHGYYRFRTPDRVVDYYDEKGSNAKKFLCGCQSGPPGLPRALVIAGTRF